MKNLNTNILNDLAANSKTMREASQARQIAREEYRTAKRERRAIKGEAIGKLFDGFMEDIKHSSNSYVYRQYSSPFTKFVDRTFLYLSPEHEQAKRDFVQAQENLAKVFVAVCKANPEDARQRMVDYANLKNLKNIKS